MVSVSSEESGGYSASFASDLPFGSYYVKERTTNGAYILSDQEYPVVFEYAGQETALVQILVNEGEAVSNELLRGRVDGVKVGENPEGGEDVTLAGALMGLFRPDTEEFTEENALLTAITGKDGSFSFENIPYGHWIVKEISAPDLYTVSPQQHHVYIGADGQHIEIRVENTLIRGSVQVTKTEAVEEPSPVEKEDKKDKNSFLRFLPGAVFDLYADSNANQEYDPDDQKIGTLKETDAGYHTAENLLAGGYFIKESKAPEGYQPDSNAYYFSITEDGQVAVVENGEAGHGFTNEAYRGNLKITKDSSDGRKDGFAIEVKSADGSYCETFTTPKSGVIEVKGLRVGIYTVTEVANRASKGRERIYYTTKGEKRISHSNPADCYECSTYNLAYQKYDRHCTCHHISTKALKSIILKTIQETCHYVSLNEREFVYSLQEESAMKDIAVSETVKNRIERNQKRVHELDMLIRKIYEDNVIGRLPDRLFQSMLTDYENEQNELNKIIETDTADMQRIIGGQNNVERFLKLVKKYENITELTPAMINEFIDKILVHEPQGKGADRTTEVEIYLNYVGQFQVPVEQHEPTEEERIAAEKEADRLRRKRESNRKYMKKIREKSKKFAEHERIAEEKSSDSKLCAEQNATSKSNRQKVKGEKIA